ncbi:pancreatic triacylglycerol lipase [Cephus cinctus]|uniref:phospholipase A1 n=1 Tax=Cephus cinctus TaxID=211228 RepID=A0AAJ7BQN6_CEPCN|nr:pancreatic triacylglycerol lipase [Cephus cinctus]
MVLRVISFLLSLGCSTLGLTEAPVGPETDFLQEMLINQMISANPEQPEIADRTGLLSFLDPKLMPHDVIFHLYTRNNPVASYILKTGDIANLKNSKFDGNLSTKVIIHGWTNSGKSYWYNHFRHNYLTVGNYNVIGVDWFAGSAKGYLTSVVITRKVGEYIADFLRFLGLNTHLNLDNVHLLGHSLGSHVAGFAGAFLEGRIGRITGLDPAGPTFEIPFLKDPKDRLDFTDAKFVDIIHTCGGTAGFLQPIGHIDFYPNGGVFRQPGCSVLLPQYCSHARAYEFFAESIICPANFVSVKCNSWMDYKMGRCPRGQVTLLGEKVNKDARGKFYLETNAASPFGKGLFEKHINKILHT